MKRWSLDARSEGRFAHSHGEVEESEGSRSTRALEDRPGYPLKENRGLGGGAQGEIISPILKDEEE